MCHNEENSDIYEHSDTHCEQCNDLENNISHQHKPKDQPPVFPETLYYGNAYVPFQQWSGNIYAPQESLCAGTIFPELNQPYEKGAGIK